MPGIRQWLGGESRAASEVLDSNPSYVFFSKEKIEDPTGGTEGRHGRTATSGQVDQRWIRRRFAARRAGVSRYDLSRDGPAAAATGRLRRIPGAPFAGAVRADFFWGSGHEAGEQAGRMRQPLRMWMLWPKARQLAGGRIARGRSASEISVGGNDQPDHRSQQHAVLEREAEQLRFVRCAMPVAAAATAMLCRLIILPITPPLEFDAAISSGESPACSP